MSNQESFIKRFLPRSLFGRSLLIILLPTILLQLILISVFLDNHFSRVTGRLAESIAGNIAYIVSQAEQENLEKNALLELEKQAFNYFEMHLHVSTKVEPIKQRGFWQLWILRHLDKELTKYMPYKFSTGYMDDERIFVDIKLNAAKDKYFTVTFPERRLFSSSSYIFLIWMVVSALFLTFIALWFMRNQIRPIRRLAIAAERFGRGIDAPSFKPTGAREVRQAANAFLEMRARLSRQIEQRTTMLTGISHDLRTPLTRLKLALSVMPDSEDKQDMDRDIDEMERMIQGYIEFMRGGGDEPSERVGLNALILKTLEQYKKEKSQIIYEENAEIYLSLKPMAMERVFTNLISNAVKFADNIYMNVIRQGDYVDVTISDDGPGIPADKYDDVFKAFVRLDKSRNIDKGGIGLGLSIARDIVLSHGGQIMLGESRHGGLEVIVRLPV